MPEFKKWFADRGDQTHRLNYALDKTSIVLDVGGYEGRWASQINDRFGCIIHIFEPVQEFADNIKRRFEGMNNIHVHEYGIANRTGECTFHLSKDASSIYVKDGVTCKAKLLSAVDALLELKIDASIDLVKINIEGCEYDLLEHMIDSGIISKFKNIQVQFHEGLVEDSANRMSNIQKRLSNTHELTWQYTFVWENWRLKE